MEIASGVPLVWARRDGVGVVVAEAVSSALSVLAALVPVDVAVLSFAVSANAFVLVPFSALRNGWRRQRRADHGRARDRAERVVKGSFHSGVSW